MDSSMFLWPMLAALMAVLAQANAINIFSYITGNVQKTTLPFARRPLEDILKAVKTQKKLTFTTSCGTLKKDALTLQDLKEHAVYLMVESPAVIKDDKEKAKLLDPELVKKHNDKKKPLPEMGTTKFVVYSDDGKIRIAEGTATIVSKLWSKVASEITTCTVKQEWTGKMTMKECAVDDPKTKDVETNCNTWLVRRLERRVTELLRDDGEKLEVKSRERLRIELKNPDAKVGFVEAAKGFADTVQAAAVTCIWAKALKVLRRVVCDLAVASVPGMAPSALGIIELVGSEYGDCIKKEIPLIGLEKLGALYTIVPSYENWDLPGNKIKPFHFLHGLGPYFPAVDDIDKFDKWPWVRPLLRFLWLLCVEEDLEVPDATEQAKAILAAEEEEKQRERDAEAKAKQENWEKQMADSFAGKFRVMLDHSVKRVADGGKAGAVMAGMALWQGAKKVGKVAQKANTALPWQFEIEITTADVITFLWDGVDYLQDTACDYVWAFFMDSLSDETHNVIEGFQAQVGSMLALMPDAWTQNNEMISSFMRERKYLADMEKLAAEAQKDGKRRPEWHAFVMRQVWYGMAEGLTDEQKNKLREEKKTKNLPVDVTKAELKQEQADARILVLIDFLQIPIETNMRNLENYLNPTDNDIMRAIDIAIDHCGYEFKTRDMYTLMCDADQVLRPAREDALILWAMENTDVTDKMEDDDFIFDKEYGFLRRQRLSSLYEREGFNEKIVPPRMEHPGRENVKPYMLRSGNLEAMLAQYSVKVNELMNLGKKKKDDTIGIDNSLKRYLILKGYFFTRCVHLQAMYTSHSRATIADLRTRKEKGVKMPEWYKGEKIEMNHKIRYNQIKRWQNYGGMLRYTEKRICEKHAAREHFAQKGWLKYEWKGFMSYEWKKVPEKKDKQGKVIEGSGSTNKDAEHITWANLCSASSISQFMAMIFRGSAVYTDPNDTTFTDKNFLVGAEGKKECPKATWPVRK